ncbi:hypothetical protein [Paenarthrobacter sp. CAP02]|uniref:hypothetical protein n=1 Tax=Paenarthrobacter sp. CAP02 TaxID=3158144 RepID=UPI0032DA469D
MRFIVGAWADMRYTVLLSSFVLALPLPILLGIANFTKVNWDAAALIWFALYAIAHVLLYPLARELYFCLTEPIRRGVGQLYIGGLLLVVTFILKIWIYLIISVLAIPLGLIGFAYLGLRARYSW